MESQSEPLGNCVILERALLLKSESVSCVSALLYTSALRLGKT